MIEVIQSSSKGMHRFNLDAFLEGKSKKIFALLLEGGFMFETLSTVNNGIVDRNLLPHYLRDSFNDVHALVGDATNPPENARIYRRTPDGRGVIVAHQSRSVNVYHGPDGGIISKFIQVDPTKKYRFSIWLKKSKTQTNGGRVYFGVTATNDEPPPLDNTPGNVAPVRRLDNSGGASNPYFFFGFMPETHLDEWFLFVSYMRPSTDPDIQPTPDTGIYRASGEKITIDGINVNPTVNIHNEFRFDPNNQHFALRSFMYYATGENEFMETLLPRIDVVDGTESGVDALISGFTHINLTRRGVLGYNRLDALFKDHLNFTGSPFSTTHANTIDPENKFPENARIYRSGGGGYFFVQTILTLTQPQVVELIAKASDGVIALMIDGDVVSPTNASSGNIHNTEPFRGVHNLSAGTHRITFYCCSMDSGVREFICSILNNQTKAPIRITEPPQLNNWRITG